MKKSSPFSFKLDVLLLGFFIILSSILLAFSSGGFIVNFKSLGFSLLSETQRGFYSISSFTSNSISAIKELKDLKIQYEQLLSKLEDYEVLQRSIADVKKENLYLKEQLGFSESLEIKNIFAEIIGRDPNSLYSGITINRGSKQGIKKHMPVIAFQGGSIGLVGKIIQVGRNTSIILPIYDYQCYVSSRLSESRYDGLVNGQGSYEKPLLLKYIKKRAKDEIKLGEMVVTSGENLLYPKNIPIGFIKKVIGLDYETSLTLELDPIVDFSRLENVFILVLNDTSGD